METGRFALIIFYSIFWAAVLGAVSRYHPFDTAAFFSRSQEKRRHAIYRFLMSFIILNIGPIMLLWFLYTRIVPDTSGVYPVIAAGLASLSVFGFHRILHAVIATQKTYSRFYFDEEWEEIIKQSRREPKERDNTFVAHFFPGIVYLIFFPVLAIIIGRL